MGLMARLIWKSLSKSSRSFVLDAIPEPDRHAVNRILSNRIKLPNEFCERGFIFIHIPKTAGTSLRTALSLNSKGSHLPLSYYERVHNEGYKKFFKFCFVRNPWSRLYSTYNYILSRNYGDEDIKWKLCLKSLDSFENFVLRYLSGDNIIKNFALAPQYKFIVNSCDVVSVDFVGRFESIESDYASIRDRVGGLHRLERENVGISNNYKEVYNAKMIDKVYNLYKRDVIEFGYEF